VPDPFASTPLIVSPAPARPAAARVAPARPARPPARERVPSTAPMVRGRYDAAQTTPHNTRHWINADSLSAREANSPEVRRLLRERARYESANNSYCRGIVLSLANDLVGTGPRLQLLTEDQTVNRAIERAFMGWADAIHLAAKLRTAKQSKTVDGEGFGILATNPELPTEVQLDLRLIEADQCATPDIDVLATEAVDGIVFDRYGNPREYHFLRTHPGDTGVFGLPWGEYDRVSARSVVHWFRQDRPGQARGVPELTPALELFAQLRRYTQAVIAAAETAASFAVLLESELPPDAAEIEGLPWEQQEIEHRMMTVLPAGYKMAQLRAEQPAQSYREFKHEILDEIIRCVLMPSNIGRGNSADHNYASGRLDHQTYDKAIEVERGHLELTILDRVFAAWIDEAALAVPGLVPDGPGRLAGWPHQWFWDGRGHVDPQKEASAQETRLKNHTTTYAYEFARQGRDWETEFQQIAKERALMDRLGLTPAPAEPQPAGAPTGDADDD
jgi:lambda family phage portal protein